MVDSCWFYHTYNLLGILMEIFNSAYIQFVQMLILYWFLHGWPKYDKESLVEREEKLIQMYLISSLTTQKSFDYHRLWDKQNNCAICQIWHNDKYIICSMKRGMQNHFVKFDLFTVIRNISNYNPNNLWLEV